jgi:N-acetyltransferase
MLHVMDEATRTTEPGAFTLEPMPLRGQRVHLEVLAETHMEALVALFEPDLWQWYNVRVDSKADLHGMLRGFLAEQARGQSLVFAVRDLGSGALVGSSRFLNVNPINRGIEVGSTWYTRRAQRTYVNTEAKLLMLTHAFETLRCVRVQLQTDERNVRSRAAIERLGAKFEGCMRDDRIRFDGRLRTSALYSILAGEWPEVRARLDAARAR